MRRYHAIVVEEHDEARRTRRISCSCGESWSGEIELVNDRAAEHVEAQIRGAIRRDRDLWPLHGRAI